MQMYFATFHPQRKHLTASKKAIFARHRMHLLRTQRLIFPRVRHPQVRRYEWEGGGGNKPMKTSEKNKEKQNHARSPERSWK